MDKEKLIKWIGALSIPGIGPTTFWKMLKASKTLPEVDGSLEIYEKHKNNGVQVIAEFDERYPKKLKKLYDTPPIIYIKGNVSILKSRFVAIVGARNASVFAKKFTQNLASELVEAGFGVISGLARGIDSSAHIGGIGKTCAVIAGGIDQIYPKENEKLFKEIEKKGCIISEDPIGVRPSAPLFPRRNRIIAALSDAVIVVEAALKSGSLITCKCAIDMGIDVFSVPGAPYDSKCEGNLSLLKDGAYICRNVNDVLEVLGSCILSNDALNNKNSGNAVSGAVSGNEISDNIISCNGILDNETLANKNSGNTVSGNEISDNIISCNGILDNAIKGNATLANKNSGNPVSGNEISDNIISCNGILDNETLANKNLGNTVSGNEISDNIISCNGILDNERLANKNSGNAVSGNEISYNSELSNAMLDNKAHDNDGLNNKNLGNKKLNNELESSSSVKNENFDYNLLKKLKQQQHNLQQNNVFCNNNEVVSGLKSLDELTLKDEILGLIGASPIQMFEIFNNVKNHNNVIEIIAELEMEGLIKRMIDGRIVKVF